MKLYSIETHSTGHSENDFESVLDCDRLIYLDLPNSCGNDMCEEK